MSKKKPQHMYELLGQKAQEAREAAAARSALVKSETGQTPAPVAPRRRFVPAEQAPVPAPGPIGTGHERALEDVITLRRDTAIVGILLVIVVVVVAFVIGRATAPTFIEDKGPEPGLRPGAGMKEENKESPAEEADTTPAGGEYGERRFEQPGESGAAEEQPPAQPVGKWYVQLGSYQLSDEVRAQEVAEYLREKKSFNAKVEKSGNALALRVFGYETKEEAAKAKIELAKISYRGRYDWTEDKTLVKKKD